MRAATYVVSAALMTLALSVPVVAQTNGSQLQELSPEDIELNSQKYPACLTAHEESIRRNPKDANAYYRLGVCLFVQVRQANQLAVSANRTRIQFVEECNANRICDTTQNKAKTAELESIERELRKNFENARDKSIDAFAKAVAIGGEEPEIATAKRELEKLYRTKNPGATKPLDGLDDLIAQKKKELGE